MIMLNEENKDEQLVVVTSVVSQCEKDEEVEKERLNDVNTQLLMFQFAHIVCCGFARVDNRNYSMQGNNEQKFFVAFGVINQVQRIIGRC
jgi:IMP cyclohydrolase